MFFEAAGAATKNSSSLQPSNQKQVKLAQIPDTHLLNDHFKRLWSYYNLICDNKLKKKDKQISKQGENQKKNIF